MTVIAYATADVHAPEAADAGAWKTLPEAGGDALYGLRQAAELCAATGVPLLAAGDVLDGPDPEPLALAAFYDALRPLTTGRNTVFAYVLGNRF